MEFHKVSYCCISDIFISNDMKISFANSKLIKMWNPMRPHTHLIGLSLNWPFSMHNTWLWPHSTRTLRVKIWAIFFFLLKKFNISEWLKHPLYWNEKAQITHHSFKMTKSIGPQIRTQLLDLKICTFLFQFT